MAIVKNKAEHAISLNIPPDESGNVGQTTFTIPPAYNALDENNQEVLTPGEAEIPDDFLKLAMKNQVVKGYFEDKKLSIAKGTANTAPAKTSEKTPAKTPTPPKQTAPKPSENDSAAESAPGAPDRAEDGNDQDSEPAGEDQAPE